MTTIAVTLLFIFGFCVYALMYSVIRLYKSANLQTTDAGDWMKLFVISLFTTLISVILLMCTAIIPQTKQSNEVKYLKEQVVDYKEYSVNDEVVKRIWTFKNGEEYIWTAENTIESK
jgi:heme/copper-type cytochrome/quinol oxidase subunit 2